MMKQLVLPLAAALAFSSFVTAQTMPVEQAGAGPATAPAGIPGVAERPAQETSAVSLVDKAKPSLVVVQFTYAGEMGRRDLAGTGVVVRADGLTIINGDLTPRQLPDEQMKDFKIILPGDDETEIDATFLGRDERYGIAYVKPAKAGASQTFVPLTFVERAVAVGETVHTVGLLPKVAGYGAYQMSARVAALLRGPTPQVLVDGAGLGIIGSPVLNAGGEAIGLVGSQPDRIFLTPTGPAATGGRTVMLNDPRNPYGPVEEPTRMFVPARDFLSAIEKAPSEPTQIRYPFLGVTQLTGLSKDVAEFYGLGNIVAVQIGDVIPDFSAAKAGLKRGMIITALNGQPLERGDLPEESPMIFTRQVSRLNVGDTVKLSVITQRGQPAGEVAVTLDERPAQANRAKRFTAEDLGFTLRDVVFDDTYGRKLPRDTQGAVVAFIRPQSAAQAAELGNGDFITQVNQTPVTGVDQFQVAYEEFRKARPREAVVLEALRGGNTQIIRIEPPRE